MKYPSSDLSSSAQFCIVQAGIGEVTNSSFASSASSYGAENRQQAGETPRENQHYLSPYRGLGQGRTVTLSNTNL